MKRIFVLILAVLLLSSLVACSNENTGNDDPVDLTVTSNEQYYNAGGNYNDRFEYEIINGDEVAIIGFVSDYTPHEIAVPSTIEECPVVEISEAAFYQCSQITSVTIPASVLKIGQMAFAGCAQLTEVKFPTNAETLKEIDDYAFAYCSKLTDITLPNSLKSLGAGAFFQCKALTEINIPNVETDGENNVISGITAIYQNTFMGCEKLATITDGEDLVAIGAHAFYGCKELTAYTVHAGVTSVGAYAFGLCDALDSITFANTEGWCYLVEGETYETVDVSDPAATAILLQGNCVLYTLERR